MLYLCRYWVGPDALLPFMRSLATREAAMQEAPGFQGLDIRQAGQQVRAWRVFATGPCLLLM